MTISNIVDANIITMSLVLRDLDKVPNNDICLILFKTMQMHQAYLPDCSTTTQSVYVIVAVVAYKEKIIHHSHLMCFSYLFLFIHLC